MTAIDGTVASEAMAERLFDAAVGALELFSVHLGWRLGLYGALAASSPMTSGELAGVAAIDERYAREWLEQQAVAGFLTVDDNPEPSARRFSLPEAHAAVFTDPDSTAHVAPFGPMLAGIGAALPAVVDAYRTGRGVPYAAYGDDFRQGQGAINRPGFRTDLASWLSAVPGVDERLRADPPGRVADVGCGQGWSTVAIAAAYPLAEVVGLDLDTASVDEARAIASGTPDPGRLRFLVGDAVDLAASGPYDLVCVFEALHDMARPEAALTGARAALARGGSVLIVDERVNDTYTAPTGPVERMMYGWSVLHCLPASRAEQPSAALGTALRAPTVLDLARRAGFATADVLPIEHDWFRFYRLAD